MFLVFLTFTEKRGCAGEFMDGHNLWLKKGFDEEVFSLAGSLQPARGGAILAHGVTREELEARVQQDPFVQEGIVAAEIHEWTAMKAEERLGFLVDQ